MKNSIVSFDNTEIAFTSKSNEDLNRAYWLFKIISFSWLVKISPPFVKAALALHLPVKGLIKKTIFKHFCGGETIEDCHSTIEALGKYHIGTILDYSVEGKETEEDHDHTLQQTLASIERAKGDSHIPFSVFKPTGMGRLELLEKASENKLSREEAEEFNRVKERFEKIGDAAHIANVPIFIDAEETWMQPAVDDLADQMIENHNKERALIYNTIQLYRTDRLDFLKRSY
jgi:proline dehydrogenase